nr:MAG TPA: protein of unknown function DUF2054 [Caudoviricetes sp.]
MCDNTRRFTCKSFKLCLNQCRISSKSVCFHIEEKVLSSPLTIYYVSNR